MKIIVVDDSRAMRLIIRRTLREAALGHHHVEEATDGEDALEKIRLHRPHLVLSDWNMDKLDGIGLLAAIHREHIPLHFGFVTAEGTEEAQRLAKGAGASFLITKPFTPDDFAQVLGPLLRSA